MSINKVTFFLLTIFSCAFLIGCSEESVETKDIITNTQTGDVSISVQQEYTKKLISGTYYIRHADFSCEPVYFGNASFQQGSKTDIADYERMYWFRDDYDKIPTFNYGDSLIYYSTEAFTENFILERFKDLGYTVGLRGLYPTNTDRFAIDVKMENSYPESDTDVILQAANDHLLIDKIGKGDTAPLRKNKDLTDPKSPVTVYGTLNGLSKNTTYDIIAYDGTVEYPINATANIKAFGSMEVENITDYNFEHDQVIVINIPTSYHNGYYSINGEGLFRYAYSKNEDLDNTNLWNIPNQTTETVVSTNQISISEQDYETTDIMAQQSISNNNVANPSDSINVSSTGIISLEIEVYDNYGNLINIQDHPLISAGMLSPDRQSIPFTKTEHGFQTTFNAEVTGTYKIEYYNMAGFTTRLLSK